MPLRYLALAVTLAAPLDPSDTDNRPFWTGHPDSALRQAAERSDQRASALATEISLDSRIFEAIAAVDLNGADPVTRHYVSRILRDFRLAGTPRLAPGSRRCARSWC